MTLKKHGIIFMVGLIAMLVFSSCRAWAERAYENTIKRVSKSGTLIEDVTGDVFKVQKQYEGQSDFWEAGDKIVEIPVHTSLSTWWVLVDRTRDDQLVYADLVSRP